MLELFEKGILKEKLQERFTTIDHTSKATIDQNEIMLDVLIHSPNFAETLSCFIHLLSKRGPSIAKHLKAIEDFSDTESCTLLH